MRAYLWLEWCGFLLFLFKLLFVVSIIYSSSLSFNYLLRLVSNRILFPSFLCKTHPFRVGKRRKKNLDHILFLLLFIFFLLFFLAQWKIQLFIKKCFLKKKKKNETRALMLNLKIFFFFWRNCINIYKCDRNKFPFRFFFRIFSIVSACVACIVLMIKWIV